MIRTEEKQKDKPSEYEKWLERHKPNCNRNYTGSSQAMEPEAAERIWDRSLERNRLVYSVFIGDGDSKAFQHVTSLNPYPLVKVRKEECLTHVAKRLKKNLKKIKRNTKKNTYIISYPNGKQTILPLTILLLSYRTVEQHLISCHELYAFSSIMLQGIILAVLLERTHGVDGISHLAPQYQLL